MITARDLYSPVKLDSGSMVQALEIGTPVYDRDTVRLGCPSFAKIPPTGIGSRFAQTVEIVNEPFSFTYLVLLLTQSADNIAEYPDKILHAVG